MPVVSVITPASRGVKELTSLLRDFRNQTFSDFEHIIVWDGEPPTDVVEFMEQHKNDYNIKFYNIKKDTGNISIAPGTKPRNYGITQANGAFVVFADDDDRYRDTYLEALVTDLREGMINVVQMSCSEARMYKDGDPTRIKLIPEVGLPYFPMICHIGTPCFIVPREWAEEEPWREEPEHDFRFIKRIYNKFNAKVTVKIGMQVDVDGLVIQGMHDWVSHPPFFRG